MRIPHSKGIESIQEHLCAFLLSIYYIKSYTTFYIIISFVPLTKNLILSFRIEGELRDNKKGVQQWQDKNTIICLMN